MDDNVIKNPVLNPSLQGKSGVEFFNDLLPRVVGLSFIIGVVIFLFIMLLGGIQWISSGGDKTALEGARGKITNAVIGIIILFSLFAILKIVEDFFGINILTVDLGPLVIR
jgi:hypothetical protein